MTFCIITHVSHTRKGNSFFAYSPYVNEMNIWLKYAAKVIVAAPLADFETNALHTAYQHENIEFIPLEPFNTLSVWAVLRSVFYVPVNCWRIFWAMKKSNHLHLRCPGNIGLLGCVVQILFPAKKKTAKYAGNWDPEARQPVSYQLQKWLLSNTTLTKNIQVLIYGIWPNQTQNLRAFFTATYYESEKEAVFPRSLASPIRFVFAGNLSTGKQPVFAAQLIDKLHHNGHAVQLTFFGEGAQKKRLQQYLIDNQLEPFVQLKGNQNKETLKKAYQESHFLILPSKSEGWPKVVAEAMFWGCLPIATPVSCVGFMLDMGNRGLLLQGNLEGDALQIAALMGNQTLYDEKVTAALNWSRHYTTDVFEAEIKKMMQP